MVSAQRIRAGAAYVELYADDNMLTRGLRTAQKKLKAFGTSISGLGKDLLKVSAIFATPLIGGVKVFADFEKQMANVSTMLQEPEKYMDAFKKGIRDLSVELGESTETLAGGLYDILSASVPAEKAMGVLAVSARAAKAGMTDTKTAADAITTVLNAYGLSADRAADVSDLLFAIVVKGKTTFAQLAPSIGQVVTVAATAGVSLEELGATLAVMTRNGVQTDNAMTALTAIVSSFLKPSAEAVEYARELGFEMSTTTIKSEGLAGIFERISKLPPDAIAKLFPNVRALRGVLPALQNMQGFTKDMEVMASRAGAAETAYSKMAAILEHSLGQVKQALMTDLAAIGDALSGSVENAAQAVKRWAIYLRETIEKNKELVVTIAKVVAIAGVVGGALVAVGGAVSLLGFSFGSIAAVISGVGSAIGILITSLAAILSPIGLVTAAVIGLGAYIVYASGIGEKALAWLGDVFDSLKDTAITAWKGISDALAAGDITLAAKILWLSLKMEWQKGVTYLNEIWLGFKDTFVSIFSNAMYDTLAAATIAWGMMEDAWLSTTSFLMDAWTKFTSYVTKTQNELSGWIAKRWIEIAGVFDKSIDVEFSKSYIDEDVDRVSKAAQSGAQGEIQKRQAEREEANARREARLASIAQAASKEEKNRNDEYTKSVMESEKALSDARKEWQEAIAQAATARVSAEINVSEDVGGVGGAGGIEGAIQKLSGIGDSIDYAASRVMSYEVMGTFSAETADRMGLGSDASERTARASEETAKNTRRMAWQMEQGGLVFE